MTAAQPSPAWMLEAACLDMPPDLFFPVDHRDADSALAVCAACPVRAECLDYADREGIQHGVWGGLTQQQRTSRRGWRCIDCGTGVPTCQTRRCRACAAQARRAQQAAYGKRRRAS